MLEDCYTTLAWACSRGDLPGARNLVAMAGLAPDAARSRIMGAFTDACTFGHVEVARWMVETFAITRKDMPRGFPLRAACQGGNLEVVQWFTAHFKTGAKEIYGRNARCAYNDKVLPDDGSTMMVMVEPMLMRCAMVLRSEIRFDFAPRRGIIEPPPFTLACENGHIPMIAWLQRKFPPTPADIRAFDNHALRSLCRNDNSVYARGLAMRFDLGMGGIFTAFGNACAMGRVEQIQWLVALFKIQVPWLTAGLRIAACRPHNRLAIGELQRLIANRGAICPAVRADRERDGDESDRDGDEPDRDGDEPDRDGDESDRDRDEPNRDGFDRDRAKKVESPHDHAGALC